MIYGYIRVSTVKQASEGNSLEGQKKLLLENGVKEENIYKDIYTGTKSDRPSFNELINKLEQGDTLVVTKLDRFARSMIEGSKIVNELIDKGIRVNVLNIGVMDDEVIRDIIDSYTREAGVRNLERTIGKICRKVAKKYVENPSLEGVVITKADLDEYLGKNRYRHQLAGTKPEVGIVTGLAWTAVGGETLTAEVNVLKGKGQVVLTGKLGTVMKESAKTGI